MTTFSDILDVIDSHVHLGSTETIPLAAAYDRVLARSISSSKAVPPFDVSALDGYALKGGGTQFTLKGLLSPFSAVPSRMRAKEAFFVPTGRPLSTGHAVCHEGACSRVRGPGRGRDRPR